MKTALVVITMASSLLLPRIVVASDTGDADHGLESTIRTELPDKHVHVHVHEGIVTLDGKVPTETDRQRIESVVRTTPGVVALKDELKVTLPSPGVYGVAPTVPVYMEPLPAVVPSAPVVTPAPVVTQPAPVVTQPPAVVIPDYPRLRVQPWSIQDQPLADRIAQQLRADAVPTTGIRDVTIVARDRNVSLQGAVDSHADRDALIASLRNTTGINAIYDQLHIR
jgi:hypothetical protein